MLVMMNMLMFVCCLISMVLFGIVLNLVCGVFLMVVCGCVMMLIICV